MKTKRIVELSQKFDHIWGLPLAILLLILCNLASFKFFGDPLISTEYLSPIFLTACVVTGIHAIVQVGMILNHRGLLKKYSTGASIQGIPFKHTALYYLVVYGFYFMAALIIYFHSADLLFK